MSALITHVRAIGAPASTLKGPTGVAVLMVKKKFKESAEVSIDAYYFIVLF